MMPKYLTYRHAMQPVDAARAQGRGVVRQVKGLLGCVRYHTEDTCIWQIDYMTATTCHATIAT